MRENPERGMGEPPKLILLRRGRIPRTGHSSARSLESRQPSFATRAVSDGSAGQTGPSAKNIE